MTVGIRDSITGTARSDTFTMGADTVWGGTLARNSYDPGLTVSVAGKNRSYDSYGGAGSDYTLNGTSGDDALFFTTAGSARRDAAGTSVATAEHFSGIRTFSMGAGDDVLDLTAGAGGAGSYAPRSTALPPLRIYGESNSVLSTGVLGDDALWAGRGDGLMSGDIAGLSGTAAGGDDLLHGGAGRDDLRGDAVFSLLESAVGGDDTLYGGTDGDFLIGDAEFIGGSPTCGDDVLVGGAGDDILAGDAGTFRNFTGVRGSDEFLFGNDSGRDTIGDFQADSAAGAVADTLRISRAYGFTSFGQLQPNIVQSGGDAVVRLDGANDTITLQGVTAASLTAADFVFY